MEKDWKADLLLVQKLMGSRRIGSKKPEDLMQTYSVHFSRKIKTQNKEKEGKKDKKEKETSGWNIVLWRRQEGCYLSQQTNPKPLKKK